MRLMIGCENTSEATALIVRFVAQKIDDLTRLKLPGFANADLELARRAFGDSYIPVIFGELDGEGI